MRQFPAGANGHSQQRVLTLTSCDRAHISKIGDLD